jgi:hypothetical protein
VSTHRLAGLFAQEVDHLLCVCGPHIAVLLEELLALLDRHETEGLEGLEGALNGSVDILLGGNGDSPELLTSGRVDTMVLLVAADLLAVDSVGERIPLDARHGGGLMGVLRGLGGCSEREEGAARRHLYKYQATEDPLDFQAATQLVQLVVCLASATCIAIAGHWVEVGQIQTRPRRRVLEQEGRQHLPLCVTALPVLTIGVAASHVVVPQMYQVDLVSVGRVSACPSTFGRALAVCCGHQRGRGLKPRSVHGAARRIKLAVGAPSSSGDMQGEYGRVFCENGLTRLKDSTHWLADWVDSGRESSDR